ncbi:alpha/beta hydrolase [Gramella sp. GC03-9]|uniref:Alpha/beta hydrolase n=1 Tax=Christiangramia oceanisediminis TaxID=2920386 RepID=A0A9X2I6Q5_9FLAO|nr:alpha/beta hydrolase [Gramella oceanisediminis]MCP9198714.1 alpha/beta hydrolase [Gramella oceanisediminis]
MKKRILVSILCLMLTGLKAQKNISEILSYPSTVQKIKLDSEEIVYLETGKGATSILFVHGLSSTLQSWENNLEGLGDDFRCIAIDLPGYGKSSRNRTDYSLSEYADMIREFIQKKELENVILAGHSMGGQIAMHTVLEYPEVFEKLVLVAPAGIETFTPQEATLMKSSYTPAMLMASSDEQILANYKLNFYEFPESASKMVEQRIAMKEAGDFPQYAETVVNNIHAMLDEPVIERISEISIPVLMIFGKNDMLIPNRYFHPDESIESLVETSEEKFKDLEVEVIDEAGHFVNFEKATEVNQLIRDFAGE